MKLRKFKRGENFFFQMLDNDDKVILESQSYQSKDARDNGVESVKENIRNADRYDSLTEGGKSYFILKAANHQEIARSVAYDSNASMEAAMKSVQSGSSKARKGYGTDGRTDDYKPLSYYESRITGVNEGFDKFSADGEHYFTYNLDGLIYMISEGYKTEASRDNGISSVEKNMGSEARYQRERHANGKYYFNLKAGNNQEIATSRWFDGEGDRNGIIERLTGGGSRASKGATSATGSTASAQPVAKVAAVKEEAKKPRNKRAKKPKVEKIIVSTGAYPCSDITYQVFIGGNGKHYFTYRNKAEDAILISSNIRGFATKEEVDAIINKIATFGSKSSNFEEKTTTNDKFYYYLKDDDGKNLGKSFFFKTQEEMRSAMKLFDCGVVATAASSGAAGATNTGTSGASERRDDDYLPCRVYSSHINDKHPKYADFIIFSEKDEFYFAWVSGGDVVMRSERYTTEKARDNGIESVRKNRDLEDRFSIEEKMGYHFTILKAGNRQEIARSCPSKDREGAMYWYPSSIKKREEEAKTAAKAKAKKESVAKAAAAIVAPKATEKAEKREDDYLHCSYYEGKKRSDKYSDFSLFERQGEFYFAMLDSKDNVVLRSEGYKSEKGRENGIQSVIKNRDNDKRWSIDENRGIYFNVLKAGNHQEIGRGCPTKEKPKAFSWGALAATGVATGAAAISSTKATVKKESAKSKGKAKPKDKEDDYLACKEYAGRMVNDKQNNVALFKHAGDGQFYFALYDNEGNVRLRSEGFRTAKERDEELSGVLKYHDEKDMYKRIKRGKYYMDVLYDKTGREVGRSCLHTESKEVAVAASAAAVVAATRTPSSEKKVVGGVAQSEVVGSSGGGFKWWWLLLPLLLLALCWFTCNKCQTDGAMTTPVIETPAPTIPEPETVVPDSVTVSSETEGESAKVVEQTPPPEIGCNCDSKNISIFNVPTNRSPVSVDRLGTLPEFGNSHGLTPTQFYNKLSGRYRSSNMDKAYLDYVFSSMGYRNGFSDAKSSLFSNVQLDRGQSGLLGFGTYHGYAYNTLNTSDRDRQAFHIKAANGCDVHFMKTCGNYMFFCE